MYNYTNSNYVCYESISTRYAIIISKFIYISINKFDSVVKCYLLQSCDAEFCSPEKMKLGTKTKPFSPICSKPHHLHCKTFTVGMMVWTFACCLSIFSFLQPKCRCKSNVIDLFTQYQA